MQSRTFLTLGAAGLAMAGCTTGKAARQTTAVVKAPGGGDPRMRGPFPIMSTPYNEDGSVDYESLGKAVAWVADNGCPGVIWCQSNDTVDLLTFEEKVKGYEACVRAMQGKPAMMTLGCNGTRATMLREAKAIEEVAKKYPRANVAMISRPPDDGKTENDLRAYFEALATVATRPVIIQTHVNKTCPDPSVALLIELAKKHPAIFGYIKEESGGSTVNDRMIEENKAKPVIHTVFSAWGGWQWLYQSRRCGSEGLITERCAYAPLLAHIWREMESRDAKGTLTQSYAFLRLMIDQRNMPTALRGYSLYYFQKLGLFKTTVSRQWQKVKHGEEGSTAVGDNRKWRLEKLTLTDLQKAELDECYADMMRFVREHN